MQHGRLNYRTDRSASILVRIVAAILCVSVLGCGLEPATKPSDGPIAKPVVSAGITAEMKAARAAATKVYRDDLTRIADDVEAGRIVYDTKLALEINAVAKASQRPIQELYGRHLPQGKIEDGQRKSAAETLRQIRDGYAD